MIEKKECIIMGHGYAFAIASRIGADFPEAGFVFYNRGISGNKIPDLEKRWQTDTLDLKPDVLSMLLGINDTGAEVNKANDAKTVQQFEEDFPVTNRIYKREPQHKLEQHKLVKRIITDGYPVKISYKLEAYANTLTPIIYSLKDWGVNHRKKIIQKK